MYMCFFSIFLTEMFGFMFCHKIKIFFVLFLVEKPEKTGTKENPKQCTCLPNVLLSTEGRFEGLSWGRTLSPAPSPEQKLAF